MYAQLPMEICQSIPNEIRLKYKAEIQLGFLLDMAIGQRTDFVVIQKIICKILLNTIQTCNFGRNNFILVERPLSV